MRYHQLTEHFLNLFTPEEKQTYAQQVWDILQKSYEQAGGFHTAADVNELIAKTNLWKLAIRDGHIFAVALYKDKNGRKSIASGTDGSPQGKKDFMAIKSADVKLQRAWAEVSGAPELILKRGGSKPIPNKFAAALTKKEILELNPDGYHYTRMINGHKHEKVIYGFVNLDSDTAENLTLQGIDLNELPPNMRLS